MRVDNIKKFLKSLNNPQDHYKTIHIGGSNGKGSTAYFLYQMIKKHHHVGLYISPFTMKRFDNIIYDEHTLSELESLFQTYYDVMVSYELTPFEMDTALMYLYFSLKKVDYAVIEVGLGGRDDATNVITPEISIITSISLEHQEILGHRIEDIIKIKSGIFKKDSKVIISPFIKIKYQRLFIKEANKIKSLVIPIKKLEFSHYESPYLNQNYALAYQAYHMLNPMIKIEKERLNTLPFRFETINHQIILDGAHNIEGMESLVNTILKRKIKPVIIMSSIKTKPIVKMIDILKPHVKNIYITHFDHMDSYDISFLKSIDDTKFIPIEDLDLTIKQHEYDTIIITGSLYFLRELNPYLRSLQHESKFN